jgi:uncharacterized protein YjbI with pentapeptide repeats
MQGGFKTILDECDLRGVELGKAKLNGVSLIAADLSAANLVCADLENALLSSAILRYMCRLSPAFLPLPWHRLTSAHACIVVDDACAYSDARMMEVDARGADMQKCCLHRVNLDQACLVGAKVLGSSWKEVLPRPRSLDTPNCAPRRGAPAHLLPLADRGQRVAARPSD